MIKNYATYMTIDHFMAFATTNIEESSTFVSNNLSALWYITPLVLIFVCTCIVYFKASLPALRNRLITSSICVLLTTFYLLPFENINSIDSLYKFKAAVFENTFTRPPLNIIHLSKITIRKIHRSMQTNDFQFHSTRTKEIAEKEIYVLAIGESVRYSNCSLNGIYIRQTMPLIAQQDNLVFFHNYYSSGTTTSVSVPMIVTRATAEENALNYQERGIVQVFNENGFTTVVIKRGILSQISSAYLYQGVDFTEEVKSDAEVIEKVDSLSRIHDKLFIMFQLQGSHFYYDNFTEEFNKWRPNCKTDKGITSDSLYINAYDNTILYTDYLLNTMIDSLNTQNAHAAVWYVSDHGQTITSTQGWHGTGSKDEYHVPLYIWFSESYKNNNPTIIKQLQKQTHTPINSDNIFYTICGMTHIQLPLEYAHPTWDISSTEFVVHPRQMLLGNQIINLDE
jgi:glucan phosphoethanolaminetransferase (alkaline phosphatase superfamily)